VFYSLYMSAKPLFLLFILMMGVSSLNAQTRISGKVTDKKGRPLYSASITLKDSYDGATSDSAGNYSFTTTETGTLVLVISASGYQQTEIPVTLDQPELKIDVQIKEQITELKAVVISAGTFEAGDKGRTTVLNSIDIATTASGMGDITGALKTLPGAQQVGETEGLFVRGGTASETRTFIDGTPVNNFFYSSVPNISQRGRFSPFLFKGTVFSTGGYSALYGQALSAALILESVDIPDESEGRVNVSVIGLGAGLQHVAKNKKSSWGVNYDYTNLWPAFRVIKQKQDFYDVPVYHTADLNFRIKTSATGILKYYGYFSHNKTGFRTNSIDTLGYKDAFGLKNLNTYHNLSWKEKIGRKWRLQAGTSFSINNDDIDSHLQDGTNKDILLTGLEFKQFGLESRGRFYNLKAVLERRLRNLSMLRFGAEYNYSNERSVYTAYNGLRFDQRVEEHIKAAFAETDIYLTNELAAKLGTRFEHSSLLGKVNIAPRASLAYRLGAESQASLAYGIFYQNPERRYLPSPYDLNFSRAAHYIAQYQKVSRLTTLRLEAYYKKYHNLIKTEPFNATTIAANNNGYGQAHGVELFWRDKKTIKNLDYWISYSYLNTKRDFLNYPGALTPNFAATHTASLVLKKFVLDWKTGFNLSYTYATPRKYYNIFDDGTGNKIIDQGETPDYHNVGFSMNYLPKLGTKKKGQFTVLVLSVNNIFGLKQIYGYNYSYNNIRRQAIIPPSRTFVFVGAFISFGVDRTDDIINNNL
jgi:vitamin B12 transporter